MKNEIKINLNGKKIDLPFEIEEVNKFLNSIRNISQTNSNLNSQNLNMNNLGFLLKGLIPRQQPSARQIEDNFFKLINEDMMTFRAFGMYGREHRNSQAILALHNRLRRIEDRIRFSEEKKIDSKKDSKKKQPKKTAKETKSKKTVKKVSKDFKISKTSKRRKK